jgi:tetratricopeptide (TPR) repeat protein
MARDGLCVTLCAGLLLGVVLPLTATPPDEQEAHFRNALAVQNALDRGLAHLQKGEYSAAVKVLEAHISAIDGNHRYLIALRDAYRGHLRGLRQSGNTRELQTYLLRLQILDKDAPKDPPPAVTPTPKPAPAPATSAPGIARGKIDDAPRPLPDDPFSDANSVQAHKARALLARAEREYTDKRYASAAGLYAEAHKADPRTAAAYRERWAYCRLHAVGLTINQGDVGDSAALEREVRQAAAEAPNCASFADKLLRSLRGAREPVIEIKHTPGKSGGMAITETANFRIFHTQPRAFAERLARTAEMTRLTMGRKWFGEVLPTWSPRCDIHLHATQQDYARATGAGAESPGHSTFSLDGGRVVSRRIDLRCDDTHLETGTLPHEATHVVLAGRFGRHDIPRWADEGMAVLSEPRARIDLHLRNLPAHQRDGRLFNVGRLMRMSDYPEASSVGAFYAQSVSLVEFLCRKKGPQTFARFLRDGLDGGYETALRRHYDINSFVELETLWRTHAFGGAGVARMTEKRR